MPLWTYKLLLLTYEETVVPYYRNNKETTKTTCRSFLLNPGKTHLIAEVKKIGEMKRAHPNGDMD
jgi:hypothetical protein